MYLVQGAAVIFGVEGKFKRLIIYCKKQSRKDFTLCVGVGAKKIWDREGKIWNLKKKAKIC